MSRGKHRRMSRVRRVGVYAAKGAATVGVASAIAVALHGPAGDSGPPVPQADGALDSTTTDHQPRAVLDSTDDSQRDGTGATVTPTLENTATSAKGTPQTSPSPTGHREQGASRSYVSRPYVDSAEEDRTAKPTPSTSSPSSGPSTTTPSTPSHSTPPSSNPPSSDPSPSNPSDGSQGGGLLGGLLDGLLGGKSTPKNHS
ncbi:hypothetical protein TR74_03860 [Carbonactinospora thermoautotrophica]|uniref:Uncharacterized protein n=1 Tax=Carbonactinospora thermoautotrophica TaxID=1469144 RepID=A0A132NK24_9ACTN|nr:hypothetical protein [Carbonactinospora thermoautotrophica]KWX02846.1 hypothetical protein LI90_3893 [Carbonactinospora thermoautotrophica]KWX10395.1 hypothetical protein TR74_03860 [Carbonactinospora thermoautotrophica]